MKNMIIFTFLFLAIACEKPLEETPMFEEDNDSIEFPNEINNALEQEITAKQIRYSWKQNQLPLKLKFDHDYHGEHKHIIRDAFDSWNYASDKELLKFGGLLKNQNFDNLEDYYLKDERNFGIYTSTKKVNGLTNQTLAITQIIAKKTNTSDSFVNYEIIHADIIINAYDFTFSINQEPNTHDLQSVILHELGHFLGIVEHSQSKDSVMFPTLAKEQVEDQLYDQDIKNIMNLYPKVRAEQKETPPLRDFEVIRVVVELKSSGEEVTTILPL